ncbi:precorrin-3B synthase [Rhizobium sp. SAFR-030]|uniref:precorrin-3B synthase n=1 Tax=Rhizobium sp. SAFR-030 TaxID=3387277 RepID=UPI003F7F3D40
MTALSPTSPLAAPAARPSFVRGACPALDAPMLTGDGYLTRLAFSDALTPQQLQSLCTLSERHGNATVDITARGNLQIRGLTETSAQALERDVRSLDLPLREGLAVEWSPLAGDDPEEAIDPRPLSLAIVARAARLAGHLAPKISVVIDGGGLIGLDHLLADIRLRAVMSDGTINWQLTLGGTAATGQMIGEVADADAADIVLALLERLALLGPKARGRDLAAGDLPAQMRMQVTAPLGRPTASVPAPFGTFDLRTRAAARIAVAFGQCGAERLHALAQEAELMGITRLRPAPDHALIAFGSTQACEALVEHAARQGFITRAGDQLAEISACPGIGACRSGRYATHETGRDAARNAAALLDGSVRLHLSGCEKGCAHPTRATLTLAGAADGTHLVFDGKTTDTPLQLLASGSEAAALAVLSALMETERRPGETSRDCLARLGPARIAAALSKGTQ